MKKEMTVQEYRSYINETEDRHPLLTDTDVYHMINEGKLTAKRGAYNRWIITTDIEDDTEDSIFDLYNTCSTKEYAVKHGLTVAKVIALIKKNVIKAEKVKGSWVILEEKPVVETKDVKLDAALFNENGTIDNDAVVESLHDDLNTQEELASAFTNCKSLEGLDIQDSNASKSFNPNALGLSDMEDKKANTNCGKETPSCSSDKSAEEEEFFKTFNGIFQNIDSEELAKNTKKQLLENKIGAYIRSLRPEEILETLGKDMRNNIESYVKLLDKIECTIGMFVVLDPCSGMIFNHIARGIIEDDKLYNKVSNSIINYYNKLPKICKRNIVIDSLSRYLYENTVYIDSAGGWENTYFKDASVVEDILSDLQEKGLLKLLDLVAEKHYYSGDKLFEWAAEVYRTKAMSGEIDLDKV